MLDISLIDEIAIIFLWVGVWGLIENFIYDHLPPRFRIYIYILLILSALLMKLE